MEEVEQFDSVTIEELADGRTGINIFIYDFIIVFVQSSPRTLPAMSY